MSNSSRASFEELLEFANKVREAGGGNPLDALMPATPQDSSKCLIAKNLNFNCEVYHLPIREIESGPEFLTMYNGNDPWWMVLDSKDLRDKIADKLGLKAVDYEDIFCGCEVYGVVLPPEIGAIASDFDEIIEDLDLDDDGYASIGSWIKDEDREAVRANIEAFLPYIEESVKETEMNGIIEDGKLVL